MPSAQACPASAPFRANALLPRLRSTVCRFARAPALAAGVGPSIVLLMRILIVEDERSIADFIERGLRSEGYAVTSKHDGESGLIEALTGDYGLLLLDVLLPGKNG